MSQRLFESTKLGNLSLHNRIVMAPMTRSRADSHGVPGALVALYYAQRSSACLIISEGINISLDAMGSAMTPGLSNSTEVKAWKKVTSAVHDEGKAEADLVVKRVDLISFVNLFIANPDLPAKFK